MRLAQNRRARHGERVRRIAPALNAVGWFAFLAPPALAEVVPVGVGSTRRTAKPLDAQFRRPSRCRAVRSRGFAPPTLLQPSPKTPFAPNPVVPVRSSRFGRPGPGMTQALGPISKPWRSPRRQGKQTQGTSRCNGRLSA